MEMKQPSSKWGEKPQVKMGDIGESIVKEILEKQGYVIYKPETDGSHFCDRVAINKEKEEILLAEIKTKPRRQRYPDTGFDIKHYEKYKVISEKYKLKVFCYFVDIDLKAVYGNFLDVLEKRFKYKYKNVYYNKQVEQVYPWKSGKIIYFLVNFKIFIKGEKYGMNMIRKLTDEEVEKIEKFSTRNEKYDYSEAKSNLSPEFEKLLKQ